MHFTQWVLLGQSSPHSLGDNCPKPFSEVMSASVPDVHSHIQLCVHWTSQYCVFGADTLRAEPLCHSGPLGTACSFLNCLIPLVCLNHIGFCFLLPRSCGTAPGVLFPSRVVGISTEASGGSPGPLPSGLPLPYPVSSPTSPGPGLCFVRSPSCWH